MGVKHLRFGVAFAIIMFSLLVTGSGLMSQVNALDGWSKTYDAPRGGYCGRLIQTADGGFLMAGNGFPPGHAQTSFLLKTDSLGNQEWWNATYGGSTARDPIPTSDGCYMFITPGIYGNLIKIDASGNQQWRISSSQLFSGCGSAVSLRSLIRTTDGGYTIAGLRPDDSLTVACFHANGTRKWLNSYPSFYVDSSKDKFIAQSSDGSYFVVTELHQKDPPYYSVFQLMKIDSLGNELWIKTYSGGSSYYHEPYDVICTNDGGCAIVGEAIAPGTVLKTWLVKTDSDGDLQWSKEYYYGAAGLTYIHDLAQLTDNGFIMVGRYWVEDEYQVALVVRMDSSRNLKWSQTYKERDNVTSFVDSFNSIVETIDGGFALAGNAGAEGELEKWWLVKMDESGAIPEFTSLPILLLFLMLALFLIVFYKKRVP